MLAELSCASQKSFDDRKLTAQRGCSLQDVRTLIRPICGIIYYISSGIWEYSQSFTASYFIAVLFLRVGLLHAPQKNSWARLYSMLCMFVVSVQLQTCFWNFPCMSPELIAWICIHNSQKYETKDKVQPQNKTNKQKRSLFVLLLKFILDWNFKSAYVQT